MKVNFDLRKVRICVHCPTEDDAKAFFDFLHLQTNVTTWSAGNSLSTSNHWNVYKEKTVYYLGSSSCGLAFGCGLYGRENGFRFFTLPEFLALYGVDTTEDDSMPFDFENLL